MRGDVVSVMPVATPLCPAGHLPLKGGDRLGAPMSLHAQRQSLPRALYESISPLEGEMSGRTEGGSHRKNGRGGHP
ncbi:hypothetical protein DSM25558_1842 [Agrobacterium sp. DSM 25558]|nr:hypothetical protein DSM25558_1842 [Agrobacterium sp. DSM 25558]